MKKTLFLSALFIVFFSVYANAQINLSKAISTAKTVTSTTNEAISSQVLSALTPSDSLNLTTEQVTKLTENNETFVSKVLSTVESTSTDEEKTSALSLLKSDRISSVTSLLGDSKATTYLSQAKEKLEPLAEKYALIKNFL